MYASVCIVSMSKRVMHKNLPCVYVMNVDGTVRLFTRLNFPFVLLNCLKSFNQDMISCYLFILEILDRF